MEQVGRRRAVSPLRTAWFWRSLAVRIGAVLGAISLVAVSLVAALGVTPVAFGTSSMAPAISTGDLALARRVPASDVEVGDVVSVLDRSGRRITHRVTSVEPYGSSIRLTLRADAFSAPDAQTYEVTDVERVELVLPLLGFVVGPLHGLVALVVGGIGVACLAFAVVTRQRRIPGERRAGR